MINDVNHWHNTQPPLCPNEHEIEIYRSKIEGYSPVYLLGMTKQLVPLCDYAIDLNPIDIGIPTIKEDWNDINGYHSCVFIGDGVLNLMGVEFVNKIISLSSRLVFRVFLRKFEWMKYATHFPTEFPGSISVEITQPDIAIVVY